MSKKSLVLLFISTINLGVSSCEEDHKDIKVTEPDTYECPKDNLNCKKEESILQTTHESEGVNQ